MPDKPCPYPNCPNQFRRQDDTGIQAVLAAIGEVNHRLGRIDGRLSETAALVAVHESAIEAMSQENRTRIDRKWVIAVAVLAWVPALWSGLVSFLKNGGK